MQNRLCLAALHKSPIYGTSLTYLNLIGSFNHLWKILVVLTILIIWRIIPYIMDNKKCLKPPTSNSSIFTYFLVDDSLQLKKIGLGVDLRCCDRQRILAFLQHALLVKGWWEPTLEVYPLVNQQQTMENPGGYPLVNVYNKRWKISIFKGKSTN